MGSEPPYLPPEPEIGKERKKTYRKLIEEWVEAKDAQRVASQAFLKADREANAAQEHLDEAAQAIAGARGTTGGPEYIRYGGRYFRVEVSAASTRPGLYASIHEIEVREPDDKEDANA